MTTDSDLAALKTKIDREEGELEQVKAALGGRVADAGDYAGYAKMDDFEKKRPALEKRLSELTADLTELRRKENVLLEENPSGAESKKKFRVFNEWTKKVQVWTIVSQGDMHARLGRSNMELHSAEDDGLVDDFDEVVPASPDELRDPESFRYVVRPTSQKSELQHANAMAHSVADKLEAEAGSWLQDEGLTPHFSQGFFHDKHNPHHICLQTTRWVNKENKSGERECDLLFTLDGNKILCFGSVKSRFTDDHMKELQADLDLLKDSSANMSIKIEPGPFRSRFPAAAAEVVDDRYVPIDAVLPGPPTVVGLAVTGVPNTQLKPRSDVVVVDSRGNFSLAPLPSANYDPKRHLLDVIRDIAKKQQHPSTGAAQAVAAAPHRRPGRHVIGSRALHSLLRRVL